MGGPLELLVRRELATTETTCELVNVLRYLVERLERAVPAHACPGSDCAICARPNTSDARALLRRIDRGRAHRRGACSQSQSGSPG